MEHVIGVDLGTSAVKVLLINQKGEVVAEHAEAYPLIQPRSGYSEQNPEDWVKQTIQAVRQVVTASKVEPASIKGLSFSGQMHGLVLLDREQNVLRNAILWNDTRTTQECHDIVQAVGQERLIELTKNQALEGFTLPKILWVKKHEPEIFNHADIFLLPKDYVRLRLTGELGLDFSDAAGTLLLDIINKEWSKEVAKACGIDLSLCPPLVESEACVGTLLSDIAKQMGLLPDTKVIAGGADNACGAIGAGILSPGRTLVSIGTSGVVLTYEEKENDYEGQLHFFNHAETDRFYSMGVMLASGYSLSWYKDTFAKELSFDELIEEASTSTPGAKGLLFTPYIVGERTPHADSTIRGSFIGMDARHNRGDFTRAVIEGITFSLNESIQLFRDRGLKIDQVVSIGGGAKSDFWLQVQADIFNASVIKLKSEQGPGMGAAMLAAVNCGWFPNLQACAEAFLQIDKVVEPNATYVKTYEDYFRLYQEVYPQTSGLSKQLRSMDV